MYFVYICKYIEREYIFLLDTKIYVCIFTGYGNRERARERERARARERERESGSTDTNISSFSNVNNEHSKIKSPRIN